MGSVSPDNRLMNALSSMRIWNAVYGGYTWAIVYEPGLLGYTASYRKLGHNKNSQIVSIDGAPWGSFVEAEEACKCTWKALRSVS